MTAPLESVTIYREYLIQVEWYSHSEAYYWTVFRGQEECGDNSKQHGEDSPENALFRAKQHIDLLCEECSDV